MPLYEYSCSKCDKIFEIIQKFSEPPLSSCPECGSGVTKVVSRTSFQLKGSGWYATDYRKSKPKDSSSDAGAGKKSGNDSGS